MADVLGIKVRLQLDAMESDKDIRNQLEKIQLPPVKVNLEIGKILNKEELNKLDFSNIEEKFKDIFKIDERVIADIKATLVVSIYLSLVSAIFVIPLSLIV